MTLSPGANVRCSVFRRPCLAPDDRQPTADQGFTLIELLVVVAILGIVLGLVIGRGAMRSPGLELRAGAGALAQTLRGARAQAILGNHDVSVAIDPEHRTFAADAGPVRTLAHGLPVSIVPPTLPGPGRTRLIRFAPDGSATGGGVVLGSGARRLSVSVEWLTGRVSVAEAR